MTKLKNVGAALVESIRSEQVKDLAIDLGDAGISEVFTKEALESIPGLGIVVKTYNVFSTIQGQIYAHKIYNFFLNIHELNLDERVRVMDEISATKGGVDEAGMLLLDLIDKSDDNEKPSLIGKLFVACGFKDISAREFLKLSNIITSTYIEDLRALKNIDSPQNLSEQQKSIFAANSLMTFGVKKPMKLEDGYTVGEIGRAIFDNGLSLDYEFTREAELIAEFCFDTKKTDMIASNPAFSST
ncbi:hypothetical protein ACOMICROBIO_NCLOACGD_01527 [Vibrio sp. B1ASS3]|uniref:hypothetical protein n=1 Tax=Vibrio sp. B1ASS3 TaxID=2751176 RepID=UPI001ABA3034|nr:hypothetical protein [Vibrio sp. B1ASS3]CAD7806140.1 hypothetical protein ACOMICROBIO_NCLOACGD_01527 [Vibrio sp. B1ASS3]CAE6901316.1 hypothetical protein ACOMICROBIO_NCLOACGD_01527 [Vibrio sp. B1ASS3]